MIEMSAGAFLAGYSGLFILCVLVLLVIRQRARREWSRGVDSDVGVSDDALALMAGGWSRLAYLMALRLLHSKSVRFKKGFLGSAALVHQKAPSIDLGEREETLLIAIKARGKGGVPMKDLTTLVERSGMAMEEGLAVRGLRAVRAEQRAVQKKLIWVPTFFAFIGVLRVYQGVVANEAFFFVVLIGVIGTAILGALSKVNPLTSKGKRLVTESRKCSRNAVRGGVPEALTAYACLGWLGIAGTSFARGLGNDVTRHFYNAHHSSSGDGGNDGGDGGCGGGCGGCGGCG
ncbi:TIGR04222 domain-containing membrane protein [Rubritalea tangerina]|uniref:TIGR04222 domain-containing membrane protein n=1 Tax=Rubritalea tangerina TaxID=430798 RepID=A0ABW4Z977_9BACT